MIARIEGGYLDNSQITQTETDTETNRGMEM